MTEHTQPAASWAVTYTTRLPAGVAPEATLQQLLRFNPDDPNATVSAAMDWKDPHVAIAWAKTQHAAVVAEAEATARLALEDARRGLDTYRQGLAALLKEGSISLDALDMMCGGLRESMQSACHLEGLIRALNPGASTAQPTDPDCSVVGSGTGHVLDIASGRLVAQPQAFGQQMERAMSQIKLTDLAPDDGRVPMEELAAMFSR